ncbi:MAG: outer membrane protein transport protein [Nitrospirota bacterium]
MKKKLLWLTFTVCGALFTGNFAAADDFHYTNLLVGDRASGMGGAYTAISDDATGLYFNPAGIAYASVRSFSASVNAYYENDKTYKNVIGGNGWSRSSSSLLPNYFGVVQPLGRFKIGFSYAVPDSIMEDQSQTFGSLDLNASIQPLNPGVRISSYIINFNNENNVYNIGPSIATEITDNLSTGLTLYYYQRKTLWILNQIIKTTNDGFEQTNQYYHANERGLRPILGFMWSPVNNVSVGLAMSKVFITSSSIDFQSSYVRENIFTSPTNSSEKSLPGDPNNPSGSSDDKRKTPKQISLGIAWFPSASLLLTADINYFSVKSVGDIVSFKGHADSGIEDVVNIALGTEYYFTRNWALRAGLYTDYANTPDVQTGGINQNEHIDLYGGTMSISHFTRNTSVTLGGGLTLGSGKAQILSGRTDIQTVDSKGWTLFLASSYSY